MTFFKKIVSFCKENTLKAIFDSAVAIVLIAVFGLFKSIRATVFNFLLFIIRKEYFYICVVSAIALLLLYRRVRNLERQLSKGTSGVNTEVAPVSGFEYFFSHNAHWKIDLSRKSFNRNPYCVCCDPPSPLLALSETLLAVEFFSTSATHECVKTGKKYSIHKSAYLFAYLGAKEEYGVYNPDLEKELEKMRSKSPKPA